MNPRLERADAVAVPSGTGPTNARLAVVSVCPTLPTAADPAAGIFVVNRVAALARLMDVRVVQPVPYFPLAKPLAPWSDAPRSALGLSINPAPTFYLPRVLKSLDGRWFGRSAGRMLARLGRQHRIDLIDAHFGYPNGVGCVRAGAALGVPVFVTIRGLETELLAQPAIGAQVVRALNAAAGCISVSHSLARLAIEHGVNAQCVRVIPNGIDRSMFSPGPKEAARYELGLDPYAQLIVSVGHLISRKRHQVLVRAIAGLRRLHPAAQLVIVSGSAHDRSCREELARVARESGVAEHVRIVGPISQPKVNSWLQAADVFALASRREGCCNAVLEALAAGRPVVTTPVGDNSRVVRPGVNGALVPVDDVAGFERSLSEALQRTWDAAAISRGLQAPAWTQVASQALQFFRDQLINISYERAAARG